MSDGDLLWKLVGIAMVLLNGFTMLVALRRKPAITEEMYRDFATKEELRQLRAEFLKTAAEIFDISRQLKQSLSDLNHAVGRIEGALSRCPGPLDCAKDRLRQGG